MPKFIVRFSYDYSLEITAENEAACRELVCNMPDEVIKEHSDFNGIDIDIEEIK